MYAYDGLACCYRRRGQRERTGQPELISDAGERHARGHRLIVGSPGRVPRVERDPAADQPRGQCRREAEESSQGSSVALDVADPADHQHRRVLVPVDREDLAASVGSRVLRERAHMARGFGYAVEMH